MTCDQVVVRVAGAVETGIPVSKNVLVATPVAATVYQHYAHERAGYQITALGPGCD